MMDHRYQRLIIPAQPKFFNAKARFVANVDLPTPPLALEIAIVNLVPEIGFFDKGFFIRFF